MAALCQVVVLLVSILALSSASGPMAEEEEGRKGGYEAWPVLEDGNSDDDISGHASSSGGAGVLSEVAAKKTATGERLGPRGPQLMQKHLQGLFLMLHRDNKVSFNEFLPAVNGLLLEYADQRFFKAMDTNGDGGIEEGEFIDPRNFLKGMIRSLDWRAIPHGEKADGGMQGIQPYTQLLLFSSMIVDANSNGAMDLAEFTNKCTAFNEMLPERETSDCNAFPQGMNS
eukprot:CAMPEP_0115397306 /NCGR_PEP_ID=MMETSP0271-20121206/13736_1 /TAXON_ID=71861 /ORGANISM="Scrippsiella trochoidea, Strain CCMP3099" /LENGTH=227 /DNA_ID=CAMNT_0002821049 /DNA_START=65 /DNA_END=745 /DNA_ORIENTATION=+